MINQELLSKFWQDFIIPTQEENEDFPFANVGDVVKSLIKSRNWIATLTKQLVEASLEKTRIQKILKSHYDTLIFLERSIAARTKLSFKNKDHLKIIVWANSDKDEKDAILEVTRDIAYKESDLDDINTDINILENLLKRIEKSTDWLVQYINWNKFELRGLKD